MADLQGQPVSSLKDTDGAEYNIIPGWRLETGTGGFGEKGDRWVCVRNLESQCGQDFYEDRDRFAFNFLRALADVHEAIASLKDTPALTPELEAALRCSISPVYAGVRGTESYERAVFFGEIDRLRAEVAELAQQRGDLLQRVVALQTLVRQVLADAEAQEVLWEWYGEMRNAVASDSQPSEQTR